MINLSLVPTMDALGIQQWYGAPYVQLYIEAVLHEDALSTGAEFGRKCFRKIEAIGEVCVDDQKQHGKQYGSHPVAAAALGEDE